MFIGGDEHSKEAKKMDDAGVSTIAIPKTIDYDFLAESMGSHTAVSEARSLIHRAHEMAKEEKFVQVVEFMGRDTGWIAYLAAKDLGKDSFVLLPEKPSYFKDVLIKALEIIRDEGYLTVPMAEGYNFIDFAGKHKENEDTLFYELLKIVPFLNEKFHSKGQFDVHGNPKLSGIAEYLSIALRYLPQLADRIKKNLPDIKDEGLRKDYMRIMKLYREIKERYPGYFGRDVRYGAEGEVMKNVRLAILGYVLRGLPPDRYDDLLGEMYGRLAVRLLIEGKSGVEVTINKTRKILSADWLRKKGKKALRAREIGAIALKEYIAEIEPIEEKDREEASKEKFAFADEVIGKAGVWWKAGERYFKPKKSAVKEEEKVVYGADKVARRLFLSTAISADRHNTASVFGFREAEDIPSDRITLYAADQNPDDKMERYQRYILDETKGTTKILRSDHPSYFKDLLLEILRIMNKKVAIRDNKRRVRTVPHGYVNLAVSDKYKLLDFEDAALARDKNNIVAKQKPQTAREKRRGRRINRESLALFNKLLELDPVLKARYEFDRYFFDKGEPGFM